MRHAALVLLPALLLAGCGSSTASKIPEPAIGIEQVVGPAELNYPYGPFDVKYNLGVQNNAPFPITLIRISMSTSGPAGGAYSLRREFYNFKEEIPPRSTRVVSFWAHAYGFGRNMRDTEPVTLRAIVYFNSSEGMFQKVYFRELSQFPGN